MSVYCRHSIRLMQPFDFSILSLSFTPVIHTANTPIRLWLRLRALCLASVVLCAHMGDLAQKGEGQIKVIPVYTNSLLLRTLKGQNMPQSQQTTTIDYSIITLAWESLNIGHWGSVAVDARRGFRKCCVTRLKKTECSLVSH